MIGAPFRFVFVLWISVLLSFSALRGADADLPDPMSPRRLVNDFAGLLAPEQRQALERKLVDFDRETSTQIAVATVSDLGDYAPSDFAQRLHDKWGIGHEGKNNGILVLVKPSQPGSRGEVYISVGYGLEGVVPDITAGRIIDNEMLPAFRDGDLYGGIDRGTDVLMRLTRGEFTAEEYNDRADGGAAVVMLLVVLLFVGLSFFNRRNGRRGGNGGSSAGGWFPPIFMGGGGSHGGGFGGGGFGGFGGGLSGGGGAGRSW